MAYRKGLPTTLGLVAKGRRTPYLQRSVPLYHFHRVFPKKGRGDRAGRQP